MHQWDDISIKVNDKVHVFHGVIASCEIILIEKYFKTHI